MTNRNLQHGTLLPGDDAVPTAMQTAPAESQAASLRHGKRAVMAGASAEGDSPSGTTPDADPCVAGLANASCGFSCWLRWLARQLANPADESVTPLRYRFEVLGILSERFAQDKDVSGEVALDKRVGPKRVDKFLFLHKMAAVADQEHQGIEGLR